MAIQAMFGDAGNKQTTPDKKKEYQVIIIGGGPAGLTAAMYNARAELSVLVIEMMSPGGQAMITDDIENYPGFPEGIKGFELAQKLEEQAKKFGAEILLEEVTGITNGKDHKTVHTPNGDYTAKAVIISTGATPRRLGIPGEETYRGRGVSYCATCDGAFFKNKEIIVVGGGDTAVEEAIFLTRFASKVTLVHRRDRLRATKIIQERAKQNPKIEFIWNSIVKEIKGSKKIESVILEDVESKQAGEMKTDGIFIFVGIEPQSDFVKDLVDLNEEGYIKTDDCCRTSAKGIFTCGDVRAKLLRQFATAVGEGATAAFSAQHYTEKLENREYE